MNAEQLHLLNDDTVKSLQAYIHQHWQAVLEEAIHIQQIPAPTFSERQRAKYVQERMVGLANVEIDVLDNVYGCLVGTQRDRPALLVSAHTDTVFSADTDLTIDRRDGRIYGPGLGDNSIGVASLLACADWLRTFQLPCDIWFVANTREEGMGDLGGIKAAYAKLKHRIGAAIIIEGMSYGLIYHGGIAVRRLRVECHTQGGHSWTHFGRANAIHHLMQVGTAISSQSVPTEPRTTFNIGVVEGGRSVNTIADQAWFLLDMRSESIDELSILEQQVRALIAQYQSADVQFEIAIVGDRPAGYMPRSNPLAQYAYEVLCHVGAQPDFRIGSTDANALLAANVPTVTIGITTGGNAHRTDEYIETAAMSNGLWQLALLVIGVASGTLKA